MQVSETSRKLLAAKARKGLTFADLEKVLGRGEVWIAALFYGQAAASREEADRLSAALGLDADTARVITEFPIKGLGPVVPTDPLIYRFYEIIQVYGMPLKAVIHEKFGDGIMSAIDFTVHVDREPDPQGRSREGHDVGQVPALQEMVKTRAAIRKTPKSPAPRRHEILVIPVPRSLDYPPHPWGIISCDRAILPG